MFFRKENGKQEKFLLKENLFLFSEKSRKIKVVHRIISEEDNSADITYRTHCQTDMYHPYLLTQAVYNLIDMRGASFYHYHFSAYVMRQMDVC